MLNVVTHFNRRWYTETKCWFWIYFFGYPLISLISITYIIINLVNQISYNEK